MEFNRAIGFYLSGYMFEHGFMTVNVDLLEELPEDDILQALRWAKENADFLRAYGHFENILAVWGTIEGCFQYLVDNPDELNEIYDTFEEYMSSTDEDDYFFRSVRYFGILNRAKDTLLEKVCLQEHIKETRREFAKIRSKIYARLVSDYGAACRNCGSIERLEVDHIIAVKDYGGNEMDNFQLLCRKCHIEKSKGKEGEA